MDVLIVALERQISLFLLSILTSVVSTLTTAATRKQPIVPQNPSNKIVLTVLALRFLLCDNWQNLWFQVRSYHHPDNSQYPDHHPVQPDRPETGSSERSPRVSGLSGALRHYQCHPTFSTRPYLHGSTHHGSR